MKKFFEPFMGFILSLAAWEAWTDLIVSLIVAFLGGALAYLGKWACQRLIAKYFNKGFDTDQNID